MKKNAFFICFYQIIIYLYIYINNDNMEDLRELFESMNPTPKGQGHDNTPN